MYIAAFSALFFFPVLHLPLLTPALLSLPHNMDTSNSTPAYSPGHAHGRPPGFASAYSSGLASTRLSGPASARSFGSSSGYFPGFVFGCSPDPSLPTSPAPSPSVRERYTE